jgi:hypothetical protein
MGLFNPRQPEAPAGMDNPIQLNQRLSIRQPLFKRFDEPDTTPDASPEPWQTHRKALGST